MGGRERGGKAGPSCVPSSDSQPAETLRLEILKVDHLNCPSVTSSLVTNPAFVCASSPPVPPPSYSKELRHGQQGPISPRVNPELLEAGLKSQRVLFFVFF